MGNNSKTPGRGRGWAGGAGKGEEKQLRGPALCIVCEVREGGGKPVISSFLLLFLGLEKEPGTISWFASLAMV